MGRAKPRVFEVGVVDMDRAGKRLVGIDGRTYHEVGFNVWVDTALSREAADVVYLGTGRHGGGVTLRPLFYKADGAWYNFTTGRRAPEGMPFAAAPSGCNA